MNADRKARLPLPSFSSRGGFAALWRAGKSAKKKNIDPANA